MWFCTKTYLARATRDIGNDHEDVSQQRRKFLEKIRDCVKGNYQNLRFIKDHNYLNP